MVRGYSVLKFCTSLTPPTYVSFSDQKVELSARKDELDKGRQAIRDLIEALDMRKDEAIERTFKGVAKNFNDIPLPLSPPPPHSLKKIYISHRLCSPLRKLLRTRAPTPTPFFFYFSNLFSRSSSPTDPRHFVFPGTRTNPPASRANPANRASKARRAG